MVRNKPQIRQYRRKGQSLIAANKIKPEKWDISNSEAKEVLQAQGYNVKDINGTLEISGKKST